MKGSKAPQGSAAYCFSWRINAGPWSNYWLGGGVGGGAGVGEGVKKKDPKPQTPKALNPGLKPENRRNLPSPPRQFGRFVMGC